MASSAVKLTLELKAPTELGTHHRLICMTGPSKGKVYYLVGKRIIIGRSDKADIQIIDNKISREHAEISFANEKYTITDLGTPNGILVGNKKVPQHELKEGLKIVIGQSVLQYNLIQVSESNNMITTVKGEKKTIKPKLQIATEVPGKNVELDSVNKNENSDEPKKKPKLIFIIILLVVFFVLFDSGDAPKKESKNNPGQNVDAFNIEPEGNKSKKNSLDEAETKKKFLGILHEGQREVREGNYFRAIENFNRSLQIIPNNGQASYYLEKAKQKLNEEIEKNLSKGNTEYDSKKFVGAISSYCSIIQLLQNFPEDERYLNALAKIAAVEVELGKEKGEIKCIEEKSTDKRD